MAKPPKQVKIRTEPAPVKRPKWDDHTIGGAPLAWRFSICDRDGPFSWAVLEAGQDFSRVFERLAEFERKSLDELHAIGCHPIECHRLEKPARSRLSRIKQDDVDELMSFRMGGTERVWCIQDQNIMRVIWWDPKHLVYLVEPDRADRAKRHRRRRR